MSLNVAIHSAIRAHVFLARSFLEGSTPTLLLYTSYASV